MSSRVDLPYSGNTICEIRKEARKTVLTFFRDNKQIGQKTFVGELTEDTIVDGLATSGIEFMTFSAVYDAAGLILKAIETIQEATPEKEQLFDTDQVETAVSIAEGKETGIYKLPADINCTDLGDLILNWNIPYSHDTYLLIFRKKRQFCIVFAKDGAELYREDVIGNLNEKRAYKIIEEGNLQFVSMSVSASVVDKMRDAIQSPQKYPILATSSQLPKKSEKAELKVGQTSLVSQTTDLAAPEEGIAATSSDFTPSKTAAGEVGTKASTIPVGISEDAGSLLNHYEIPYAEESVLDIYYNEKTHAFTLVFLKENKIVYQEKITSRINTDQAYNIINAADIQFVSMSTLSDLAGHIEYICTLSEDQIQNILHPKVIPEVDLSIEMEEEKAEQEFLTPEESKSTSQTPAEPIDIGVFVKEINIPYSHDTTCKIFWNEKTKKFALSFWREGKETGQALATQKMTEDDIWNLLSEAGIDFISMSVISDSATELYQIFQDPEKYIAEQQMSSTPGTVADGAVGLESSVTGQEEESTIDYSMYKTSEDIDSLVKAIKRSLGTDRPVLVKESKLSTMKNIFYHIYRQGENKWSFEFFDSKDNKPLTPRPLKLKAVNFDEVFRVVNNGIPQITLSAVNDAAEEVYSDLKSLAERPADDLVFNQVVSHFEKIITEQENAGDLEGAIQLAEGLMKKLEELNSATGVAKFGAKIAGLYEKQDRMADSALLRTEIFPKLLQSGDFLATKDFLDDSLALFTEKVSKFLDAAQMAVEFSDEVLKKKKNLPLAMQYIKSASQFYKEANLPVAQADHNFRYGKLFLQLLRGDESPDYFTTVGSSALGSDEAKKDASSAEESTLEFNFEDNPFASVEEGNESEKPVQKVEGSKVSTSKGEALEKIDTEESIDAYAGAKRFDLRPDAIKALMADIVQLFSDVISVHTTRKDRFEILENVTEIILMFRRNNLLEQEAIFAQKGVDIFQQYNEPDRALRLGLQMIEKLMGNADTTSKGLEFFNQVIKLYYDKNDFLAALELSFSSVTKLIKFKQKDIALQYLEFTSGLLSKIYPTMTEESLQDYLKLAQLYQDLEQPDTAMKYLTQVLSFKRKSSGELIGFCLDTARRFLKGLNLKFAQDFINAALQQVGNDDLKLLLAIAEGFSIELFNERQPQLSMQYLTYAYQVAQGMPNPVEEAGGLIIRALERFLKAQNIEAALTYIESLLPIVQAYYQNKQAWKDAAKTYTLLVDALLTTNKTDLKIKHTKELATYYHWDNDKIKAADVLIKTRDNIINRFLNDARELTDIALKLVVELKDEGYKKAIEYLQPLVKELINQGKYEDGYIYGVQTARYYESLQQIDECTIFLTETRTLFENKNRIEDAERITSLMVRLNRQGAKQDVAAKISLEYFDKMVEQELWEQAYLYITTAADIAAKKQDYTESNRLLQTGYETFFKSKEAENEAEDIVNEIVKFRRLTKQLTSSNELDLYKDAAIRSLNIGSTDLSNKFMSKVILSTKETDPGSLHGILTDHILKLFGKGFYEPSLPYISDLLTIYITNPGFLRDTLFYYLEEYLKANEADIATKLADSILERLQTDLSLVIGITMRFIQMLVEHKYVETAKKYLDRAMQTMFPRGPNTQAEQTAAANIYQKFAIMVLSKAPEIAIEYGVQAADIFRKIHEFDKMIDTYLTIADKSTDLDSAVRLLKRAQFQCEQVNIPITKQMPILRSLVLKEIETKSSTMQKDFQNLLTQMESERDLKQNLAFLEEAFSKFVRMNQYDFFYKYLDYAMTLALNLNSSKHLKYSIRIAGQYYHKKGQKQQIAKLRTCFMQLKEPDPTEEELAYFWKTGSYEMPRPVIKPEAPIAPVPPSPAPAISTKTPEKEPKTVPRTKVPPSEVKSAIPVSTPTKTSSKTPITATRPMEVQQPAMAKKSTITPESPSPFSVDLGLSETLSAALNALKILEEQHTVVNVTEEAPKISPQDVEQFTPSIPVVKKESPVKEKEKEKEMVEVISELSTSLSKRGVQEAEKLEPPILDQPSFEKWQSSNIATETEISSTLTDLDKSRDEGSLVGINAPPPDKAITADDFGDLFKNALSNLTSLIATSFGKDLEEPSDETSFPAVPPAITPSQNKSQQSSNIDHQKPIIPSSSSVSMKKQTTEPHTGRQNLTKGSGSLNAREEEIYIELTVEYRKIMKDLDDNELDIGADKWQKILPTKLKKFHLTAKEWDKISEKGDKDVLLQKYIEKQLES